MSDIILERAGRVGYLTMDRPDTLNALTLPMIEALETGLASHEADDAVETIVLRSTSPKAFCAGGDMKASRELSLAGQYDESMRFFAIEYALNRHIARATKPYISLIDGIAMGGGLGLSIHGRHVVVSERTVMAMPETAIGFFPDVGGTHFLGRLPSHAGRWLGLTGMALKGAETKSVGLATHYVPSHDWADMVGALESVTAAEVGGVLDAAAAPADDAVVAAQLALAERLAVAASCFGNATVPAICDALRAMAAEEADVAATMLAKLEALSPYALDLSLELLVRGEGATLDACLEAEYLAAREAIRHPDFVEGIRSVLVDKDRNPQWLPREEAA